MASSRKSPATANSAATKDGKRNKPVAGAVSPTEKVSQPAVEGPDPANDGALVKRVLAGDRAAYALIVQRYQAPLFRYAMRFMKDSEEASDQVQETFVKAFRNLAKFDTRRPLGPWLYRIARNNCLDAIRRKGADPVTTESQLGSDDPDAGISPLDTAADERVEGNPAGAVEGKQLSLEIRARVTQLDQKYREVIELYHFEGMTYEEIAEVLAIPLGTVMTRLFRARKKLAETLKDLSDASE